jgi:hypothetical protein
MLPSDIAQLRNLCWESRIEVKERLFVVAKRIKDISHLHMRFGNAGGSHNLSPSHMHLVPLFMAT